MLSETIKTKCVYVKKTDSQKPNTVFELPLLIYILSIYNIKKNTKQSLGIAWTTKILNYLNKTGGFGGLWWQWWGKKEASMFGDCGNGMRGVEK